MPAELEETEDHQRSTPPGSAVGTEAILVVEDEISLLGLTQRQLRSLGYRVLGASTPAEAREKVKTSGPVDLLVTDVIMPEMNGRELASLLERENPGLKTLFLSGYTANVIAHHGVLETGVFFLAKPFSLQALAAKVRETLDH